MKQNNIKGFPMGSQINTLFHLVNFFINNNRLLMGGMLQADDWEVKLFVAEFYKLNYCNALLASL